MSVLEALFKNVCLKETSTQVFSCEYYVIFMNSFFYRTPPVAAFVSLINCSVMSICRSFILNQKDNVEWFLLKKFADLARVCRLHIIRGNHSNTLLLINTQKTKT